MLFEKSIPDLSADNSSNKSFESFSATFSQLASRINVSRETSNTLAILTQYIKSATIIYTNIFLKITLIQYITLLLSRTNYLPIHTQNPSISLQSRRILVIQQTYKSNYFKLLPFILYGISVTKLLLQKYPPSINKRFR